MLFIARIQVTCMRERVFRQKVIYNRLYFFYKTKNITLLIQKRTEHLVNHLKLKADTRCCCKARKNKCDNSRLVLIWLLSGWESFPEFVKPITNGNKMISRYNPDWEPRRTVKRLWIILQTASNKISYREEYSSNVIAFSFPIQSETSGTRAGCG